MELWNTKFLEKPPITTSKLSSQAINLTNLQTTLRDAIHTFGNQKHLHAEAALLSRCIYRMKMKFRNDKGLKAMQKINHAILQYLQLNITSQLEDFSSLIPLKYEKENHFPTLNMLDFLLVRLQSICKLMCRVAETAKISAHFMENRVDIGHLWKVAFISFAIVARFFVLSKYLIKFSCELYTNLKPLRNHLENCGFNWVKGYEFPDKLEEWLENPELLVDDLELPHLKSHNIFRFDYDDDSDIEYCGETYIDKNDVEIINEYVDITDDHVIEIKEDIKHINENVLNKVNKDNIIELDKDFSLGKAHELDIGEVVTQVPKKYRSRKKNKHKVQDVDIGDIIELDKDLNLEKAPEADVGEVVIQLPRKHRTNRKNKHKARNIESINTINSIQELNLFVQSESRSRNTDRNFTLKHLDQVKWNLLSKAIKGLIRKGTNVHNSKHDKCLTKAKEILLNSFFNKST